MVNHMPLLQPWGSQVLVTWGAVGKVGSKDSKSFGFDFSARPLQAPGTAPVDANFISILLRMPLLVPGSGGPAPPALVDEGASGVWSAADCLRGASKQ
eukprot:1159377-Pelagomonas_calceolata.AAC.10